MSLNKIVIKHAIQYASICNLNAKELRVTSRVRLHKEMTSYFRLISFVILPVRKSKMPTCMSAHEVR